jgi:hypothetical protein
MKDTRSPDLLPGAVLLKRGAAADAHTRKPLRVLHIEDSDDDTALILRQLRRDGFLPECKRVDTLDAARAALVEQPWDILLCDYNLPGFDARDALALVWVWPWSIAPSYATPARYRWPQNSARERPSRYGSRLRASPANRVPAQRI